MRSTDWDFELELVPENREQISLEIGRIEGARNYGKITVDDVFRESAKQIEALTKRGVTDLEGTSFFFDLHASDLPSKRGMDGTQFTIAYNNGKWLLQNIRRGRVGAAKDRVISALSRKAREQWLKFLTDEAYRPKE